MRWLAVAMVLGCGAPVAGGGDAGPLAILADTRFDGTGIPWELSVSFFPIRAVAFSEWPATFTTAYYSGEAPIVHTRGVAADGDGVVYLAGNTESCGFSRSALDSGGFTITGGCGLQRILRLDATGAPLGFVNANGSFGVTFTQTDLGIGWTYVGDGEVRPSWMFHIGPSGDADAIYTQLDHEQTPALSTDRRGAESVLLDRDGRTVGVEHFDRDAKGRIIGYAFEVPPGSGEFQDSLTFTYDAP